MRANTVDKDKLRTSYAARRTRLLAKRRLEETRLAQVREALRRIDREIAALYRERMRPPSVAAETSAANEIARAARQFASTATR